MKLFAALFLISTFSFACPNLSGLYICDDLGNQEETTVSQQRSGNGVVTFRIRTASGDEQVITADGVTRSMPDDDDFADIKIKASCETNKLRVELTGKFVPYGDAPVLILSEMSLNQDNNLVTESSGQIGDTAMPPSVEVCLRK